MPRLRALALSLVMMGAASPAQAAPPPFLFDLQVAGDLDGDGKPDLIGWTADQEALTYGPLPTLTIHALKGTDGSTLWTRRTDAHYAVLLPGRVGPAGTPGVFVSLIRAYPDNGGDPEYREQHLLALDGTGAVRWERTRTVADAFVEGGWWSVSETADLLPGPADDLLLHSSDEDGLDEPLGDDQGARVAASSGSNGADSLPRPETGYNAIVPNAIGDGLAGLAFVTSTFTEVTVEVREATYGFLVWRATFPTEGSGGQVVPVGDTDGNGVPDLVYPSDPVTLIEGTEGDVLWQRPIGWPHALGDVDGDGRADVGGRYRFSQWGYRHTAVDAEGQILYLTEHTVSPDGADFGGGWDYPVGDVDADGIQDRYQILYAQGAGQITDQASGVISGRTGAFLWEATDGTAQPRALGATTDGHGDDLVTWSCPSDNTEVRALDGASGTPRWSRTIPGCLAGFEEAGDLNGDGRADLLFQEPLTVLDGSTGAILWSA